LVDVSDRFKSEEPNERYFGLSITGRCGAIDRRPLALAEHATTPLFGFNIKLSSSSLDAR
jgi:hypothetical protein